MATSSIYMRHPQRRFIESIEKNKPKKPSDKLFESEINTN